MRQNHGAGGIAGHDDNVGWIQLEGSGNQGATAVNHDCFGFVTVGEAFIVRQVDDFQAWQMSVNAGRNAQPAHTGVEYQNPRRRLPAQTGIPPREISFSMARISRPEIVVSGGTGGVLPGKNQSASASSSSWSTNSPPA